MNSQRAGKVSVNLEHEVLAVLKASPSMFLDAVDVLREVHSHIRKKHAADTSCSIQALDLCTLMFDFDEEPEQLLLTFNYDLVLEVLEWLTARGSAEYKEGALPSFRFTKDVA